MNYRKELRKRYGKGEKGIAILFALGILSVIIITVMIFAQKAATDRKVASALSTESTARMLAKSAIDRAMIQMKKQELFYSEFFSAKLASNEDASSSSDGDFDWLWKMESTDYPFAKRLNANARPEKARWQYIKSGTSASSPVVGRVAYRAYAVNRMNLNAIAGANVDKDGAPVSHLYCLKKADGSCADHALKLGVAATELDYDAGVNGLNAYDMGLAGFTRDAISGKSFPTVQSLFEAITLGSGDNSSLAKYGVERFFNVSSSELLYDNEAWTTDGITYYQRFNLGRGKNWDTITVADIAKAPVAFYKKDENDKQQVETANTAGISWLNEWKDAEGGWTKSVTDGENNTSTEPDPVAKRNQIIANLINYNASKDRAVVSDVEPSKWGEKNPSYTGNKRTWYLNEAKVSLKVTPFIDTGNSGFGGGHEKIVDGVVDREEKWWKLSGKMSPVLSFDVEAIKMYKDVIHQIKKDSVSIYGTIEFKYLIGNTSTSDGKWGWHDEHTGDCAPNTPTEKYETFTIRLNGKTMTSKAVDGVEKTYSLTPASISANNNGYAVINFTPVTLQDIPIGTFATQNFADDGFSGDHVNGYGYNENTYQNFFKIKDVKINLKLKLEDYDYAVLSEFYNETPMPFRENVGKTILDSSENDTRTDACFEVADARHNLLPACWEITESNSLGIANNVANCSAVSEDQDPETAEDPAWLGDKAEEHLSTAYIRHAPMQSLWELGAIHRAAPWQTINLKKPASLPLLAEKAEDYKYISDNLSKNLYKNGDFRILDQVTLQGQVQRGMFGKINLNSSRENASSVFAMKSVFRNMPIFSTYYDVDNPENIQVVEIKDGLLESFYKSFSTYGSESKRFYNRSDIFGSDSADSGEHFWMLFTKIDDLELETDAMQEQIIGRTINLFKADSSHDAAGVVAMAQTIKDIGGSTVYTDLNEDGLTGSSLTAKGKINLGFMRYDGAEAYKWFGGAAPSKNPTNGISTTIGKYDNGADQITGECKVIAQLLYDRDENRWKVVQVKYEE